ncbi:MAG: hypothetical protein IKH11_05695 [Bacteroidales bacterium]|nr:hypothetical protein [Bacteroidales bacterium]
MKRLSVLTAAILCSSLFFSANAQTVRWYDIKSGILKSVTDDGRSKLETTVWFDNYGDKQTTIQVTHMPEDYGDFKMYMICKGDKMFSINDYGKEAKESGRPGINFLDITDEAVSKFKLKEIGEETVMGKKCKVYTHQTKQLLSTVTITSWVWKGITLKSSMKNGRREIVTEPVEFKENAKIANSVFEVESYLK